MKYYDMNLSTTDIVCEEVWVKDGRIDISGDQDLKFVAVVNRYEGNDNIAWVWSGLWHKDSALASTVSHDSHNLTIVYDNPEEALWRQRSWRAQAAVCAP